MKRFLLLCLGALAFAQTSTAAWITNTYSGTFPNDGYIPDNNESGWAATMTLTGNTGLTVTDVQVSFSISGGWNGDLYGYLVHDTGFVVLLDRVGTGTFPSYGYGEAGFTGVTLSDATSGTSIQSYGGVGTAAAAWSNPGPYNSQAGTLNTAFDGLNVDGSWTLFFADQSAVDVSQVTSWSLMINAVPEPTTWAMIFFAAAFGGWRFFAWRKKAA